MTRDRPESRTASGQERRAPALAASRTARGCQFSMSPLRLWSKHGRWDTLLVRLIPTPTHVRHSLWHASTGTLLKRSYTNPAENILVRIPKSNVYRFGDSNIATPVFRDVDWTVKEGQNWAVIGRGPNQKTALLQVPCQKYDPWQTALTIGLGRAGRRCAGTCGSRPRLRLPVDSSLSCPIHPGIHIPPFLSCPLLIGPVRQGVRSMTTPRDMVPFGRKTVSPSERACLGSTTF